jgi:hypothetical protein
MFVIKVLTLIDNSKVTDEKGRTDDKYHSAASHQPLNQKVQIRFKYNPYVVYVGKVALGQDLFSSRVYCGFLRSDLRHQIFVFSFQLFTFG